MGVELDDVFQEVELRKLQTGTARISTRLVELELLRDRSARPDQLMERDAKRVVCNRGTVLDAIIELDGLPERTKAVARLLIDGHKIMAICKLTGLTWREVMDERNLLREIFS